jgi:hypothetical protein
MLTAPRQSSTDEVDWFALHRIPRENSEPHSIDQSTLLMSSISRRHPTVKPDDRVSSFASASLLGAGGKLGRCCRSKMGPVVLVAAAMTRVVYVWWLWFVGRGVGWCVCVLLAAACQAIASCVRRCSLSARRLAETCLLTVPSVTRRRRAIL